VYIVETMNKFLIIVIGLVEAMKNITSYIATLIHNFKAKFMLKSNVGYLPKKLIQYHNVWGQTVNFEISAASDLAKSRKRVNGVNSQ